MVFNASRGFLVTFLVSKLKLLLGMGILLIEPNYPLKILYERILHFSNVCKKEGL